MGRAHKSFLYNLLIGTNSFAVCVLKLSLKKQAIAFRKEMIKIMYRHCIAMTVQLIRISFLCCCRIGSRRCVQPPNGEPFGYR
ncbi:hypothetical protein [Eubacterium sp. OM08-24]|uniref:hypothetical protein n=1 Tax=Eubacterium sp. OM08-24 TaxID=2292352 RepID=UPI0011C1548A|nr:hypothetical protein [Eubacterium sp. OM08-24]